MGPPRCPGPAMGALRSVLPRSAAGSREAQTGAPGTAWTHLRHLVSKRSRAERTSHLTLAARSHVSVARAWVQPSRSPAQRPTRLPSGCGQVGSPPSAGPAAEPLGDLQESSRILHLCCPIRVTQQVTPGAPGVSASELGAATCVTSKREREGS